MDFSHWHNKGEGNMWHFSNKEERREEPQEKKKPDSIQKQINNKLDEILNTQREITELKKDKSLSAAQKKRRTSTLKSEIKLFEKELNEITREGTQINGIFNNVYYINDVMEDKRCGKGLDNN